MKKKILIGLPLLILIGLIILSIQGASVREIKTQIQISASVENTWKVITDINGWTKWNPTVNLAEGDASIGSKLKIVIKGKDGKDANTYNPIIVESTPSNKFRWSAKMMANFVFKNDRIILLEAKDGGTLLTHSEEFSGLMVPLMWKMLEEFVQTTLNDTNQALKKKLEDK